MEESDNKTVNMSTSCDPEDVATFFNSQRHIDDFETGLEFNEMYRSDKYTFMLKHKHFDLSPGEVLFVQTAADGYDVTVKEKKNLEIDAKPCMWLFESFWRPFAYTQGKDGYDDVPDLNPGDHNLGVRWLNDGGTEHTDEHQRVQWVRPDRTESRALITLMNLEGNSRCPSNCVKSICHATPGRHSYAHRRPHKGSRSITFS